MDPLAYLDRIGFSARPNVDLETLRTLHRLHLLTFPYENIDIQLGRFVSTDPAVAFRKLVTDRRGGWCYEMNGLFGAILAALGFQVTGVEATTSARSGGGTLPHFALVIDLELPYLVDVGFGDGLLEPLPIKAGVYRQRDKQFGIEATRPGVWRYNNHRLSSVKSFDFTLSPADPARLAADSRRLQSAPDSPYVQNLVCQRHTRFGVTVLLGRVLSRACSETPDVKTLESMDEFVWALEEEFELTVPKPAKLWASVCERHALLFPRPRVFSTLPGLRPANR